MPEYFNEAAHLLYALHQKGCALRSGIDHREVVWRLAELIAIYLTSQQGLTHAGAANWILDDLEKTLVRRNTARRPKMIAIIGTTLGNLQSGRRAA